MKGEYGIGRFGGSMRDESVQALAAREEIPVRYVRPEMEGEEAASADDREAIPVIDLGKLLDPSSSQEETANLHSACEIADFITQFLA